MSTEIGIEKDIIVLTTKTVEFLLSKNPDSLVLYMFYIKNAKIQKTNRIYNTGTFSKIGLGWSYGRYKKAKDVLLKHKLVEDISSRSGGRFDKSYININYIWKRSTVVSLPQDGRTTDGK